MTNRKAIEILREKLSPCLIAGEWKESVDVAISALQAQELSETQKPLDTISRQAAIDALCRRCDLAAEDDKPCTEKCNDIKILEKLPSAQPEIMRCGDCKHYYFTDNHIPREQWYTCELDGDRWRRPDDYCSFAVRRTDEEAD